MFELARKCNMDTCFRCDEKIEDINKFTIDHKESWLLSKNPAQLFNDMDNIAFSHAKCNYEAGTKAFVSNYKTEVKEEFGLYMY